MQLICKPIPEQCTYTFHNAMKTTGTLFISKRNRPNYFIIFVICSASFYKCKGKMDCEAKNIFRRKLFISTNFSHLPRALQCHAAL